MTAKSYHLNCLEKILLHPDSNGLTVADLQSLINKIKIKNCSQNEVVSVIQSFGKSKNIRYLQTFEMPPPSRSGLKKPSISSTLSIKESAKNTIRTC